MANKDYYYYYNVLMCR